MRATDYYAVSQCTKCRGLGKMHVPSAGPTKADLMVIGHAPTKTDVGRRRPWSSLSGLLLDQFFLVAGINRDEVYLANTIKCRPIGYRSGTLDERFNCRREWLEEEIRTVDPGVILLLGRDAFATYTPEGMFTFKDQLVVRNKSRVFVVMKHPGVWLRQGKGAEFVRRGEWFGQQFRESVKKIGRARSSKT